ncbi:matrixin family metalloprotease [Acinetobacter sp. ANC 4648]|uniref:matrixin family metalloprotease n=1 Tax=Acinetobacter sp. ANC 4648 TaxID=1977875 RepID=UPI001D172BA6|nr:matrixin family metalloprotease [Acinetobacter sp. ANC 4648]
MIFILVIATAYFTIQCRIHPQLTYNSLLDRIQHPLDTRLRYRIGSIDPRFNLSTEQLQQLTQQAAAIWQQGTIKNQFIYDPNAKLSINLIYDDRQAESDQRKQEIRIIENSRQYTDSEHEKVTHLDSQLEQAKHELNIYQVNYQTKVEQYNQIIQDFNQTQHTLSDTTRQQLNLQKQQLQQEQFELQQRINEFNLKVSQLNQQVDNVNIMNQQFNQSVDQFNHRFHARQFDKGLFNGQEINIYEFESDEDLRLTIAHEFGHALGLNHNQDPKALMYPVMKEQDLKNFKLTNSDLELLNSRH